MPDPIEALGAALQGRYDVARELDEGGMAKVYLADDLRHERKVAIKVLKAELAEVVGAKRFLAEIKTTANLQHPHILPLFDSGEASGFLFYVMPYVDGESLRDRILRETHLPVDDAIRITTVVAGALQYAHEQGVVHRDIKPANIMLSGDLPVVADFGIALALQTAGDTRLTGSNVSVGTPQYSSPEQATGDGQVDERSDVYALASVLYEMLTGEPPHASKTTAAILAKKLSVAPTPIRTLRASVPAHIDEAVAKALSAVPADRYPRMQDFGAALDRRNAPDAARRSKSIAPPLAIGSPATAFIGRVKEQAELLDRLDAVADGQGSLLLLGGEPGVGKTRLAEFVLEEARARGYMCVIGHAYELEGTPPYTPFIEQLEYSARVVPPDAFRGALGDGAPEIARMAPSLKRQFPDIGASIELPPDQFRHYLFHRYREFAQRAAEAIPLVALFEDLHWADEGSLLLIEHIAQQAHGIPMLMIGTYRDVELGVGRPLAASLERLSRQQNAHRIAVKRLAEEEVTELLAVLGGSPPPEDLVGTIFHETEGNPFFVREVFRHLGEEGLLFDAEGAWRDNLTAEELDVPEGVRFVVGRRLARVSEDCRSVLTTASVVGPLFAIAVLAEVGDVEEEALFDALEEAEAAQLIHSVKGRRDPVYGFTHELIRQTLLDTVSIPRRQRRHVKIAGALRKAYSGRMDDHASDMAYHLYQAGAAADPKETLHFLQLAGDQALAGAGFEEALAQYERALSLDEDVPDTLVPALLERKVNALDGMGRWSDVTEVGTSALDRYLSIGDTDGIARVARLVCYRLDWRARYREAADVGRLALAALSDAPGPFRARLKSQVGVALDLVDEEGSFELIQEGLEEARELGDESAILRGELALKIWHYHQGHFAEAVHVDEEVQQLIEHSTDQTTRVDFLWLPALIVPFLGRLDEAMGSIHEARRVGEQRNEVSAKLNAAFGELVVTGMRTGDGTRVESMGRQLSEDFRSAGGWARAGLFYAGLGCFWQGDPDGAAELMDIDEDRLREPRLWSSLSGGWRFRVAAYAGLAEARSLYQSVAPSLFRSGHRAFPGDGFGLHAAIEGLAVLGDVEAAAGHYTDAVESLKLGTVGHLDGLWACTTGIAAACDGDWEAAEKHFAAALRQAEEIPHVMAQFDTRRWWAWALLRRGGEGDRARALELLELAISGYERLEARLFTELTTEMQSSARA